MPKLKTHQGTKKRVKLTAKGKLRRGNAFYNHFLAKKTAARKRRLARPSHISPSDAKNIKRSLGL